MKVTDRKLKSGLIKRTYKDDGKMQIFIPTYGRHDKQHTYNNLPKAIQQRTTLVVQKREAHLYLNFPSVYVLPPHIETITPTRQHILNAIMANGGKFVMLDDDLRFDKRRMDERGKFYVATEKEILELFKRIEKSLDKYSHVGVLSREGGNREENATKECTRMMRVLAYDASVLHNNKIKFDRLPLQEDFDVTLQLLRKGYKNLVLCEWVNGQGSSGAKGGCSHFRTIELHNQNAIQLAELHKPFVKVVEKETKGAWGGQKRLDVMVQWKKAYLSSGKDI